MVLNCHEVCSNEKYVPLLSVVGALPYLNSFFGRISGPILLDFVSCNSSVSTIVNCSHNGFGITSSYCDHNDDAGVQCLGQYNLNYTAKVSKLISRIKLQESAAQSRVQRVISVLPVLELVDL